VECIWAVFIDVRADGRDLSDPVSWRIWIFPPERGAIALALRRLDHGMNGRACAGRRVVREVDIANS
jgi:hypothetical protein